MTKVKKAVAYLKADLTNGPGSDHLGLSDADSPVIKDLTNGLLVLYIVDEGETFGYVQNRDLSHSQTSEEELYYIGLENLASIANEQLQIQQTEGIFAVFLDGNFEASLILLDDLWDRALNHLVPNDFVVCIPTRDILAFCDSKSDEGIQTLRDIIKRVADGDHPISDQLYLRKNGNWERMIND